MPATTVSDLETRLRMIEDRLEIYNLIAGHPPSADTGANRWELKRTAQGWKIRRRTSCPLDGSEPARELLRTALLNFR